MAIFETYSRRKQKLPDVFQYEIIAEKLKNQIFLIWTEYLSQYDINDLSKSCQIEIYKILCKQEGKKSLYTSHSEISQIKKYFDLINDTDKILDVIELHFYYISVIQKFLDEERNWIKLSMTASEAIDDLNARFKENGVGYQFIDKKIIRIDSELLHQETIQPTLHLLHNEIYKNAEEEFLLAHEHYRHGRNKECLNECLKSFESVMKIVCAQNAWEYGKTDQAKSLIAVLLKNDFFPSYQESQLSAIRQLLEGSVPTLRNKNSSHGQGTEKIVVADHLASYVLYITGATIKLIVEIQENTGIKKE